MSKPSPDLRGPGSMEAGCDEAGRGCLAGPVVAAAVILPEGFHHPFLNDSKQLSLVRRNLLRIEIEETALAWGVGMASPKEIDEINILNASFLAMHRAIDQLNIRPAILLIDGHRFNPYRGIGHRCEIRGDARFASIAAASVLAKTHRDELMRALHPYYPAYGWDRNVGYPTAEHRSALMQHGASPHHRMSFRLTDGQLALF